MPKYMKNAKHPNGVNATFNDDVTHNANAERTGYRVAELGRNPAYMGGDAHSGGHMSEGVYNDTAPPTDESGSNINGAADKRNWQGYGKSLPAKNWK